MKLFQISKHKKANLLFKLKLFLMFAVRQLNDAKGLWLKKFFLKS